MDTIVIEQTQDYQKRMKYDPGTKTFSAMEYDSLGYARGVGFPYGWLKESGTPPEPHLDVYLLSKARYGLGDELPVTIVGVFVRSDGDHKLIAVLPERPETDYSQLPQDEKDDMLKLYPGKYPGDGYFGAGKAREVIAGFYANGKRRV